MRQVIAEVSVVPVGTGEVSVSKYVAGCLAVLDGRTDVQYQLTPMGTVLLGGLSEVLDVVKQMHQAPFAMGAQRVVTTLKIDDRMDKVVTMGSKVESVMKRRPREKPEELEDGPKSLTFKHGEPGRRPGREPRLEDAF